MRHFSIVTRLYGLIALFAAAITLLGVASLIAERSTLRRERVSQLASLVQAATGVADGYRNAASQGRMSEGDAKAAAFAAIGAMRYGNGDFLFVEDDAGRMLVHPSPKLIGKEFLSVPDSRGFKFTADVVPRALRDGHATVQYHWARAGEDRPSEKLSYYGFYKPWNILIATGVFIDDLDAVLWNHALRLAAAAAAILLALGIVATVVVRSIVRPVASLNDSMRALAAGDLQAPIRETGLRDQIGVMAKSLVVLRDGLAERARLAEAQARDSENRARRAGALDVLTIGFETEVAALTGQFETAMSMMESRATAVTRVMMRTTVQSVEAAEMAALTSTNVQAVAAATEELAASVREISTQVTRSSHIAGRAADEARRTDGIVKTLAVTAERIGDVIAMIDAIASQTNLLALNATIEAPRAGEAGRGFSVVAAEVKNLAAQTTQATGEVAAQIAAVQDETRQAVEAIGSIGTIILEVDAIATRIAATMEQQGAATDEIARNVQSAAHGTTRVSGTIADIRQGAEVAETSAGHALASAVSLSRTSNALVSSVKSFFGDVKAA